MQSKHICANAGKRNLKALKTVCKKSLSILIRNIFANGRIKLRKKSNALSSSPDTNNSLWTFLFKVDACGASVHIHTNKQINKQQK